MNKGVLGFLILALILSISNVCAIKISEVELNPAGTDAGNEWIELYNNGDFSLEGYQLINNDGDNISLSGNLDGYFVYAFSKQWLDNSNESVSLYKDSELIDKADLLSKSDDKNNDLTYQLCESNWKFINSTKGTENNCNKEEPETNPTEEDETIAEGTEQQEEEESETTENNEAGGEAVEDAELNETPKKIETIELNPIVLGTKNIKSENVNEVLKRTLPFLGIAVFCIVFGALFLIKRKNKNEFRE